MLALIKPFMAMKRKRVPAKPPIPSQAGPRHERHEKAAGRCSERADPQHPVAAHPHHQPRVDEVRDHGPHDPGGKDEAVELGAETVVADEGEGGAGHVGEDAHEVKPARRRVAHEAVVAEEPP